MIAPYTVCIFGLKILSNKARDNQKTANSNTRWKNPPTNEQTKAPIKNGVRKVERLI